jgi:hypothetical protein
MLFQGLGAYYNTLKSIRTGREYSESDKCDPVESDGSLADNIVSIKKNQAVCKMQTARIQERFCSKLSAYFWSADSWGMFSATYKPALSIANA